MNIAYINGEFYPSKEAKISIFDRGFLFGDGVYEVLPVYKGKPFFWEKHIERLNSSLEKTKIPQPQCNWNEIIHRLIAENGGGSIQIYIQITRGNQGARKHDIPPSLEPTIIAFTIHNSFPTTSEKEKGLSAKLLEDIRWLRCDIKTTSLIANILLNDEAVSAGYQTSLLTRDGIIYEGGTTNVFIVSKDNLIKTPPLTQFCLPGVTRQIVIDLIKQLKLEFSEEPITQQELFNAQEVWVTSTTKEIFPVKQINDTLINNGEAGSIWRLVDQAYQQLINHHE